MRKRRKTEKKKKKNFKKKGKELRKMDQRVSKDNQKFFGKLNIIQPLNRIPQVIQDIVTNITSICDTKL